MCGFDSRRGYVVQEVHIIHFHLTSMTSPVIETNIERILQDHLWDEVELLENRISDLLQDVAQLEARKIKLEEIAKAAGISRINPPLTEGTL